MVSQQPQQLNRAELYKFEQVVDKFVHRGVLPQSCLSLESIKPLELELQRRRIVDNRLGALAVHPLWFIAETERNVFLWRNGFSLQDEALFEFWIDPDALINKRILQLASPDSENPFINSLMGLVAEVKESVRFESEYLKSLQQAISSIAVHAHALGFVASEVRKELLDGGKVRPRILLPI